MLQAKRKSENTDYTLVSQVSVNIFFGRKRYIIETRNLFLPKDMLVCAGDDEEPDTESTASSRFTPSI